MKPVTKSRLGKESLVQNELSQSQVKFSMSLNCCYCWQISEWSLKHPTERILDIDLPLSYGVMDLVREPCALNVVSFKWDPSR